MQRESKPAVTTYVALLRGVNVGGKNMIRMSALKAAFERLGFGDVATYINSGNVLFDSRERDARKLEKKIEGMLAREFRLESKVVVRMFSEIENLFTRLPKHWNGDKRWRYNVIFLRHSIDSEEILKGLDPRRDIEDVAYRPGTLLWSARASDLAKTRMLKLSSRKIFQDMTVRNLNTTRKLYELMKKRARP